MIKKLFENKWAYLCLSIIIAAIFYTTIAIKFHASPWMNSWLTVGGTILAIAAAVLIMFFNKECSDKSTSAQIQHLTTLTNQQILANQLESKKQIDQALTV